jgi:hypothetical protein
MSRYVCFIAEEDGQVATCIVEDDNVNCSECVFNPFRDRHVPEDRVLRK